MGIRQELPTLDEVNRDAVPTLPKVDQLSEKDEIETVKKLIAYFREITRMGVSKNTVTELEKQLVLELNKKDGRSVKEKVFSSIESLKPRIRTTVSAYDVVRIYNGFNDFFNKLENQQK